MRRQKGCAAAVVAFATQVIGYPLPQAHACGYMLPPLSRLKGASTFLIKCHGVIMIRFILMCVLCVSSMAYAANEVEALDNLIAVTKQNLEAEMALRGTLVEYLQLQARYMENTNDKDQLFSLAKSAHRLFKLIKENHLTHVFNNDFLSELTLFSQVAEKKGIPQP